MQRHQCYLATSGRDLVGIVDQRDAFEEIGQTAGAEFCIKRSGGCQHLGEVLLPGFSVSEIREVKVITAVSDDLVKNGADWRALGASHQVAHPGIEAAR